ncbi:hypothetical protein [Peribacillus simplex]|nr:hypothetical protein [Peribacillus simplex]
MEINTIITKVLNGTILAVKSVTPFPWTFKRRPSLDSLSKRNPLASLLA